MITTEEVERIRAETDGTKKVIHLNNAGCSLPPNCVRDGYISYLNEEAIYGGYEVHAKRLMDVEHVYMSISQLINSEIDEIAILQNATVAWNMAFQAIDFKHGDTIFTCRADYASNYISYLHLQRKVKVEIVVVPDDAAGQVDVEALDELVALCLHPKLISIVHMPTNSGLVNPIEEVGRVAAKHKVLYLVDACQSVGQYPIDVATIQCDMLSATGRKYMRGPRGTGFLYVRAATLPHLVPQWVDLHSATWTSPTSYKIRDTARKFENWESNYGSIYAFGIAVDYILGLGADRIWERVQYLGNYLRAMLSDMKYIQVHDIGACKSGIVSFSVMAHSASEVKDYLHERNINISVSKMSSSRLDMEGRELTEVCRASVHYFNTEYELDEFCANLRNMLTP